MQLAGIMYRITTPPHTGAQAKKTKDTDARDTVVGQVSAGIVSTLS
jgi:hypothetical protein